MSLKKYIFAGLIGIVSLGSCTYLDKEPDTEIDIDMVFENKTKVESWLLMYTAVFLIREMTG